VPDRPTRERVDFLSEEALVLVALDPEIVHEEIAARLGCTRRAVINFLRTEPLRGGARCSRAGDAGHDDRATDRVAQRGACGRGVECASMRRIAPLVTLLFILTFAACGGSTSPSGSPTATGAAAVHTAVTPAAPKASASSSATSAAKQQAANAPTATPVPPTTTPVPPTATLRPPTATPVPPTATPVPLPTPVPRPAPAVPSNVTAVCRDGTYSYSQHRQGTCSHHGGVAYWVNYPPS